VNALFLQAVVQGLGRRRVDEVGGFHVARDAVGLLELCGEFLELFAAAGDKDDVIALRGQLPGKFGPEAGGGACDKCSACLCHVKSPMTKRGIDYRCDAKMPAWGVSVSDSFGVRLAAPCATGSVVFRVPSPCPM